MPCNPHDVKEECASSLVEACSLPSDAESLARKPAAEDVVGWDFFSSNSGNISGVDFSEVLFVGLCCIFVPLIRPYRFDAGAVHTQPEAADAGE